MQAGLYSQREGDEAMEITCNINVVIVFEDAAAGKHAQHFYDHLKDRLGAEFELTRYQWSFNLLEDPHVRDAAAQDATMADIVIIVTHGTSELPEHVDRWLQGWGGRNAGPVALVALFDQPAASSEMREEVRASLARIAQNGGMDFFAQPEDSPSETKTEFINRLAGRP
jgi:hypothetical protein